MSSKILGVYKITSPTGRIYVGSSVNIHKRFGEYRRLEGVFQTRLYRSFYKYGVEAHKFEIIIECKRDELRKLEAHYGYHYKVLGPMGLNCKLPKLNDETPAMSEATKKKISKGNKGKVRSPENRTKISQSLTGKKHTDETKKKMSESGKKVGRKLTPEHLEKLNSKVRKIVLNIETGVYYESITEAALCENIKKSTLQMRLLGINTNRTPLRIV